ncbi:MAG TPA: alpha/beta fold hydrolase [Gammaproteobacteria bacterium]|nr:alpha/beta fold hydrolase [Gammaproteobacteria bacterium]
MAILLAVALICLAACRVAAPWLIRRAFRAPRQAETETPEAHGLPYRPVSIATANGRRLFAWYVPASTAEPLPCVVLLHGWGGNAQAMLPFAPHLVDQGYSVLLMDARNHGRSDEDDFSSMVKFAEDLAHALEWLRRQPSVDPDRLSVLGHSVGAAAALLVASTDPRLCAVVSIATFAHPARLMRRIMKTHHVPYLPVGWWVLRYIERQIGARFDDIAPVRTIRHVSCPVLLVHGAMDDQVPVSDAQAVYAQRASDAVQLRVLSDATHSSVEKIQQYAPELMSFLNAAQQSGRRPPA